jgi:hypothetical protein
VELICLAATDPNRTRYCIASGLGFSDRGHDGGVVAHPGLYLTGMQFLRRRKSVVIDGDNARDLSDLLVAYLNGGIARVV